MSYVSERILNDPENNESANEPGDNPEYFDNNAHRNAPIEYMMMTPPMATRRAMMMNASS